MVVTRVALVTALACAIACLAPAAGAAQTVLDRILARVNGQIVTQSDVERARALKLVDDVSSDEVVRARLEDRLLILGEMARLPLIAVSEDELSARVAEWETSLGGADRGKTLLGQHGMNDGALRAWMRDDVRIRSYLGRQFGRLGDAERAKAIADWNLRLRERAGLK
jgi:hypothetical protein